MKTTSGFGRVAQLRLCTGLSVSEAVPAKLTHFSTLGEALRHACLLDSFARALAEIPSNRADSFDSDPVVETQFIEEFRERCPQFMRVLTLVCSLPQIQSSATKYFFRAGVDADSSADLASELIARIFETLNCGFSRWPHGNCGAWVATIKRRLLIDFRNKHRSVALHASCIERGHEPSCNDDLEVEMIDYFEGLSDESAEVLRQYLNGEPVNSIALTTGISKSRVEVLLQRLAAPE